MRVEITRTTPVYRAQNHTGVFVQWEVTGASGSVTTTLARAVSPEGPFETLPVNGRDSFFFDKHPTLLSLHRTTYYRVTATDGSGNSVQDTRVVGDNLPRRNMLLRRKQQRDIWVGFKFNGLDLAILKQFRWGARCPECYDSLTRRVTKNKCTECYGTGFEGGFATPIYTRGRLGVDNITSSVTTQGITDTNTKRLWMLTYPVIEPGDVVVHLSQGDRYEVTKAFGTELQGVQVHQNAILTELSRDSIQYAIPVDPKTDPKVF